MDQTFLEKWGPQKMRALYLLFFFGLSALVALLLTFVFSDIPSGIAIGKIAEFDIRADRDYEIVDETATGRFRDDALRSVPPVYDLDATRRDEIIYRLRSSFSHLQDRGIFFADQADAEIINLRRDFEQSFGTPLSDRAWNLLQSEGFSSSAENVMAAAIHAVMEFPIMESPQILVAESERGMVVRHIDKEGDVVREELWTAAQMRRITPLAEVRGRLKSLKLNKALMQHPNYSALVGIAATLVEPNFFFNPAEFDRRKQNALKDVRPAVVKIQAGEIIIRRGSRFEKNQMTIISAIQAQKKSWAFPLRLGGNWLLTVVIIGAALFFGRRFVPNFSTRLRDLAFMSTVLIIMLALVRLFIFLGGAIVDAVHVDISQNAFYYAVPVAAGAMLIRFILNAETSIIFSLIMSMLARLILIHEPIYVVFCLVSSLTAAASVRLAYRRTALIRAGIMTGIVNMLLVLGMILIRYDSVADLTLANLFWYFPLTFLGGLGSALVVMALMPLAENMFGYSTDMQLLEMSNLNHPLLRELIIRAPGTYHHSHLVGVLAEAAAEAIGANALLVRVGAYYHDIGKIKKPHYFMENDPTAGLRHERLAPHMSALILSSHVKDGLELAREYKLPKAVADMIPQHHGTKLVGHFYQKAQNRTDPALETVDEKDFRYPGPKPQSREAGILLLADSTEAVVRALKEKTPMRIQQTVKSIVNRVFAEGQLDECDLTLKNLNAIVESFCRILNGIYHERAEYDSDVPGAKPVKLAEMVEVIDVEPKKNQTQPH